MDSYIKLSHIPRLFSFPFPVAAISVYDGIVWMPDFRHRTVFKSWQITLRLKSDRFEIHHYINRKLYVNHFPHILIKSLGSEYYAEEDNVNRYSISIDYDANIFAQLKQRNLFLNGLACWDVDQSNAVIVIAAEILELLSNYQEIGVADQLDLRCFQLLEEAALAHTNTVKNKYRHTKIEQIKKFLQQNFWKEIDLNDLFLQFGISRSSFFRKWKQIYNLSPLHYLLSLRLEESARLLLNTNLSITAIGEKLHFHSSAYFAASFKAQFGVSPRVYRENRLILHCRSAFVKHEATKTTLANGNVSEKSI